MAMTRSRKPVLKLVFFITVVLFSMMFGMLLHAYAWTGETHASETPDSGVKTISGGSSSTNVSSAPAAPSKRTVDVCRGDTLSSIAAAHRPQGEGVYSYMNKIKKANGLSNSDLKEGQILILP